MLMTFSYSLVIIFFFKNVRQPINEIGRKTLCQIFFEEQKSRAM